jgi:uncharacterized protein (UPF0335 family)
MTAPAAAMIKAFVERVERMNEEIKTANDDKRDIFAEAKGHGLDVAALKEVIRRRNKDPNQLSEHDAIVDTYLHACGMVGTPLATRVHAHEAVSEDGRADAPVEPEREAIADDAGIPDFLQRNGPGGLRGSGIGPA